MRYLLRALGAPPPPALALAMPAEAQTDEKASRYPASAAGDGTTAGGYNLSRWAEDWRKRCAYASRADPIDALQCVKIVPDGDVYVTLSGEARLRVNHTPIPICATRVPSARTSLGCSAVPISISARAMAGRSLSTAPICWSPGATTTASATR